MTIKEYYVFNKLRKKQKIMRGLPKIGKTRDEQIGIRTEKPHRKKPLIPVSPFYEVVFWAKV